MAAECKKYEARVEELERTIQSLKTEGDVAHLHATIDSLRAEVKSAQEKLEDADNKALHLHLLEISYIERVAAQHL